MDPPPVRPSEAVEPWHLSWSPPRTHRFVPERIRLPLQPPILSPCLLRDGPRAGDTPWADGLLGHHRAAEPSKIHADGQAAATPSEDRQRLSSGRRPTVRARRPAAKRETWDNGISLLRGGVAWRMMPHDLPPWDIVYDN